MRRIVNERNTKRKKAAIILKRTAVAAMCVILVAGMTACGKKTDSVQSESVSENDKYSSNGYLHVIDGIRSKGTRCRDGGGA